jgi:DNA topoisomerase I
MRTWQIRYVLVRLCVWTGWVLHTGDSLQKAFQASALQWVSPVSVASNVGPKLVIGAQSAKAAGLRYAAGGKPGITRHRRGKTFIFKDPGGRVIRDAKTLARVRALVLPPAWTDVWISTDPRSHLQATGRDAAGRKQYRYHKDWTAERDSTKYYRLLSFAEALPAIRKRTRRDLMGPACCRPRVLATVVELLARTFIRIGNEEYARKHQSRGLTTMQDRHVKIRGRKLRFAFKGKSGVFQEIELEEPRLARAVRQCQELPGQTLFQYRDEERRIRSLSSSDINAYLREISGGPFTAKDFRTWAGTLTAAEAFDELPPAITKTAGAKAIVEVVDEVAKVLGNTRAVCRKCYIHPAVFDAFLSGVTLSSVTLSRSKATAGLTAAEARLVALLQRTERRAKAA